MAIMIDNKFEIGEEVYLKTDREQLSRIIYCFKVFKNEIMYEVANGTTVSAHYDFEISKEINVLLTTTN